LEGVPRIAVMGADLHVGVAGSSRGLPLVTLANGTVIMAPLAGRLDAEYSDGKPTRTATRAVDGDLSDARPVPLHTPAAPGWLEIRRWREIARLTITSGRVAASDSAR
jgi:hypothetical protein